MKPAVFESATGKGVCFTTRLQSVRVSAVDERDVEASFAELPSSCADGLLGISFLGRFKFAIDANQKQLQLQAK